MKLVIAGNFNQYVHWLRENHCSPRDFMFADKPDDLLGYHPAQVICVDKYWLSPIYQLVRLRAANVTPASAPEEPEKEK